MPEQRGLELFRTEAWSCSGLPELSCQTPCPKLQQAAHWWQRLLPPLTAQFEKRMKETVMQAVEAEVVLMPAAELPLASCSKSSSMQPKTEVQGDQSRSPRTQNKGSRPQLPSRAQRVLELDCSAETYWHFSSLQWDIHCSTMRVSLSSTYPTNDP